MEILIFLMLTINSPPAFIGWDVKPNGMIVKMFDTNGNGRPDKFTLNRVVRNFDSAEGIKFVQKNYPRNVIFRTKYSSFSHYYIVIGNPLFYAEDVNEDGWWDIMHRDPLEDGLNGNEIFYESPSGMFTEKRKP